MGSNKAYKVYTLARAAGRRKAEELASPPAMPRIWATLKGLRHHSMGEEQAKTTKK
jgi:hypothetical protein